MNKFECEVRFFIEDIKMFEEHLKNLGGKVDFPYQFTDFYYHKIKEVWDPTVKSVRVREWNTPDKPTRLYFVKNDVIDDGGISFKRSVYPSGKVTLYEGVKSECESLVKDLGFVPLVTIEKKEARVWKIKAHNMTVVVEYIEELGWTGEIEIDGVDPEAAKSEIARVFGLLEVPKEKRTSQSVLAMFLEATK